MAHDAWGNSRLGYNSHVVKVVSGKCLIGQIARGKLHWGELNWGRCPVPDNTDCGQWFLFDLVLKVTKGKLSS